MISQESRRKGRIERHVWVSLTALAAILAGAAPWLAGQDVPYENVQVLVGAPPEQLLEIMGAISASLGVECGYCHDLTDRSSDEKAPKRTARAMMRMVADTAEGAFRRLDAPSCWTCHRGETIPQSRPPTGLPPAPVPAQSPFSTEAALSSEAYANVRFHTALPASGLAEVMRSYTQALGVGCDHCHVPGDWAGDSVLMKLVARRMEEIEQDLNQRFFAGEGRVSCWTCHRGETLPETALPPTVAPD